MVEKSPKSAPHASASSPHIDDFRLGIIIGLALCFKDLLAKLPENKPALLFNIYALNYMLGGYLYGKTKMLVAALTYLFSLSFQFLLDKFWGEYGETVQQGVTTSFNEAVHAMSELSERLTAPPPPPPQPWWQTLFRRRTSSGQQQQQQQQHYSRPRHASRGPKAYGQYSYETIYTN